jgi:hypothetical protein
LLAGCTTAPEILPRERPRIPIVIVTLDGVRAEDALAHELPHLRALAERGVALDGLRASGPRFVSLPGYREIFSGRIAVGCTSNSCSHLREPTLLDELEDVVVMASWERYEGAVARVPGAIAISAGRHGGVTRDRLRINVATRELLDRGARAEAAPGHDDYRPDVFTSALALAYLESRQPRVLVVGLGDTDEFAHRGDVARYHAALLAADEFVGALERRVDPETLIVVTTDHGRSVQFAEHGDDEASSRVWLVAAGGTLPHRGLLFSAHQLRDIAPTLRALLGLERDSSPLAGTPIAELDSQMARLP